MTMQRQIFELTDTGSMGDTGANAVGRVQQLRWVNVSGDTGGTIEVAILPRMGDTGDGWLILSQGLTPQIEVSFNDADTGNSLAMAGDRLRVKKTGATGAGRL